MNITISVNGDYDTATVVKALAERLNMSIEECEEDVLIAYLAHTKDNIIFVAEQAYNLVPDAIHLFINADPFYANEKVRNIKPGNIKNIKPSKEEIVKELLDGMAMLNKLDVKPIFGDTKALAAADIEVIVGTNSIEDAISILTEAVQKRRYGTYLRPGHCVRSFKQMLYED